MYSAFTEECAPPVMAILNFNKFSFGLVIPYPVEYGWPSRSRPSQRLILFFCFSQHSHRRPGLSQKAGTHTEGKHSHRLPGLSQKARPLTEGQDSHRRPGL